MSKEQAKVFFEALSQDKQLAEAVKEVMDGQAPNHEKTKELLSLAKAHNFNFTEDELKRSLSREDLADIAGGIGVGQAVVSSIMATTLGLGGTSAPLQLPIEQPAAIVQQQAGNAQNEGDENEAPAANVDEEVNEIRELTPEEIAERQQREEQERREREERLAQGPLSLGTVPTLTQPPEDSRTDDGVDLFELARRAYSDNDLVQRLERLERIYPSVRNYMISSRTDISRHAHFEKEIKEWLELICAPSKNVGVSLQDLLAEADFFIEQVTEATRSRLNDILPGIRHLAERMRKAKIGDAVQQQIVDFCENARAIASAANVSFEELQESLDAAYNLGEEATAIINSHFAPAPKPETADKEKEVNEICELTPEEIAERRQRAEQRRRELEERLARGPLELEDTQAYFDGYGDRYGNELAELAREGDNAELTNRVNRLNTLYYRLLYAPQGQELMERIRNYIATVGFTFDRSTASLQEQISIADALIHEAEEMLQSAEQQRGEKIREEIQQGLDALALILQRDRYEDVQTFLANRESYSREERVEHALRLMSRIRSSCSLSKRQADLLKDWVDAARLLKSHASESNVVEVLEEWLENTAFPWLTQVGAIFGVPGEHGLALEIQEFFATIDGDFTDEHLERLNELLDRAREMMMNRARAYTRFDTDQLHIRNNDLQLAQMLGIDKEYIQEKIKNKIKIKMSPDDITGTIELPDGDTVTFNFMVGSGTLVLTGSGNTVIGNRYDNDSLLKQLEKAGIVFKVYGVDGVPADEQLPRQDYPFLVRNLIIGDGITKIDTQAFVFASALRSVYLMGPVQSVGFDAIRCCYHLVEVGFAQPEKLERIDAQAFRGDYKLVSINIPQNADIAKDAFYLCDKLEEQGCPYCKGPDEF